MSYDWYDEGEGSESLKRKIAKSAYENPVPNAMCALCDKVTKASIARDLLTMIHEHADINSVVEILEGWREEGV